MMLKTINSGRRPARRSLSYRHICDFSRLHTWVLGVSPTLGRPTPVAYLMPLRARSSERSVSRLMDSSRPGGAISWLPGRPAGGASLAFLLQEVGHVAQPRLDRRQLRADAAHVAGGGQVDEVQHRRGLALDTTPDLNLHACRRRLHIGEQVRAHERVG